CYTERGIDEPRRTGDGALPPTAQEAQPPDRGSAMARARRPLSSVRTDRRRTQPHPDGAVGGHPTAEGDHGDGRGAPGAGGERRARGGGAGEGGGGAGWGGEHGIGG